jgi:hypothetical protein
MAPRATGHATARFYGKRCPAYRPIPLGNQGGTRYTIRWTGRH